MAVWYLGNDDEITDAVARLRAATDEHVVFVVPPGSRIATGRINFKLLAREAESRAIAMAVASSDEQVRALATSAGVLAAATPDAAEAALERGDAPPPVVDDSEPMAAAVSRTAAPTGTRMQIGRRVGVATVAVLGLALIGGYAALETLPTAEITLAPRTAQLGPLEVPVVALPDVEEVDIEAGQVPAVALSIPLSLDGIFEASGTDSVETRSAGEVLFSSPSQEFDQEIVAGTRVHTPAGIGFQTTEAVTLPRTTASGATSEVTAPVEAVAPGSDGNVPSGAISVVPSLESQGVSVTNLDPTTGGRIEQTAVVTAQDYDAAAVDLQNRLTGALAAYLRDPDNLPEGLVLFAETATRGTLTLEPSPEQLIGARVDAFDLNGRVDASVLAVDPNDIESVIAARLGDAVPTGMATLTDSVVIEVGEGSVDGPRIRFSGLAEAQVFPVLDMDSMVSDIAGMPISEARAILEEVGSTTVNVWPEFVSDLPDDRARIRLDILEPSTTE